MVMSETNLRLSIETAASKSTEAVKEWENTKQQTHKHCDHRAAKNRIQVAETSAVLLQRSDKHRRDHHRTKPWLE